MRRPALPLLALLAALALLTLACGGPAPAPDGPVSATPPAAGHTVVVLSLDGFRHDYPARAATPAFDRMAAEGASAGRLIPPWPSQTFPGHATLATGVLAGRHGIVNNAFVDREKGLFRYGNGAVWYRAMPLWIHATRSGLRSHVFHWVGSEGAWQGTEPAFWRPYDKTVVDETKVEAIVGWLKQPPAERPRLVMSYLRGCDKAGHVHGPDSPEVTACVAEKDAAIGRVIDGLTALRAAEPGWKTTLFVVADHGMMATRGALNVGPALAAAGVEAQVASSGPVSQVYFAPEADAAAREKARDALAALPHAAVYGADELPAAWGYRDPTRTGDLVVVAEPGWRFDDKLESAQVDLSAEGLGHHGHDPLLPEMGAVFRAWGDGVAAGATVETLRAVDLVPTVCRVLGIAPPVHADGRPLDGRAVEALLAPAR